MSIRLYILGTLAQVNNYPYRIKKNLVKWLPKDNFSDGKFYYNFEALEKKGYIREVEVIHEDKKPDKKLYTITDAGRVALEQLIYDSFKKYANVQELYIPIYLLDFVDPLKVSNILEETIKKEKTHWNKFKNREVNYEKLSDTTKQSLNFISEYALSTANTNIEWLEKLLDFVEKRAR